MDNHGNEILPFAVQTFCPSQPDHSEKFAFSTLAKTAQPFDTDEKFTNEFIQR